ncbi:MAG TPA: class I SAM-dependent methyltransferase [Rhizobacter sp.]|nr:class I SAM-dependent methyltransferase [Rhizobacter sp.]
MPYLANLLSLNSSRERLWLENAAFAASVPSGALVLDAGAGTAPYRRLFKHARYETADFEQVDKHYEPSTYVCDLLSIPVENERFDFIVFNQVLEHTPEPKAVLHELYRVLKPGGKLIYTAPLYYEEHEQPYDFYRYTQFGVRHLFTASGFVIERLDWLEGYFGTAAYQLGFMARQLPGRPSDLGHGVAAYLLAPPMMLLRWLFAACSIAFHKLEMRVKIVSRGHPKNYIAIAAKAVSQPS